MAMVLSKNEFIIIHRKDNERALFPSRIGDWLLASTCCTCFSFCYWQPKLGNRAFALSAPQNKPPSGLAFTLGDLKGSARKPGFLIFLGIETGEVLTNDFRKLRSL